MFPRLVSNHYFPQYSLIPQLLTCKCDHFHLRLVKLLQVTIRLRELLTSAQNWITDSRLCLHLSIKKGWSTGKHTLQIKTDGGRNMPSWWRETTFKKTTTTTKRWCTNMNEYNLGVRQTIAIPSKPPFHHLLFPNHLLSKLQLWIHCVLNEFHVTAEHVKHDRKHQPCRGHGAAMIVKLPLCPCEWWSACDICTPSKMARLYANARGISRGRWRLSGGCGPTIKMSMSIMYMRWKMKFSRMARGVTSSPIDSILSVSSECERHANFAKFLPPLRSPNSHPSHSPRLFLHPFNLNFIFVIA